MDRKITLVITLDQQFPNAIYGQVGELESGSSTSFSAQSIGDLYNLAIDWAERDESFKVDPNADLKEITEKARAINSVLDNNTEIIIHLKL